MLFDEDLNDWEWARECRIILREYKIDYIRNAGEKNQVINSSAHLSHDYSFDCFYELTS